MSADLSYREAHLPTVQNLRRLMQLRADTDIQINDALADCRADGITVAALIEVTGWSRQTIYTRLNTTGPRRLAIIETIGTRGTIEEATRVALGHTITPTQAGRLGYELVVPEDNAACLIETLHEFDLETTLTYR